MSGHSVIIDGSDAEAFLPEKQGLAPLGHRKRVLIGVFASVVLVGPLGIIWGNSPHLAGSEEAISLAATSTDELQITSVTCKKTAGGMSAGTVAGFSALSGVVAAGASLTAAGVITIGTGGAAAPVTLAALAAAGGSASAAAGSTVKAFKFVDGYFSGSDDLIIKVNGETVLPTSGKFRSMSSGQTIQTDIRVSFQGHARISLIEYDSGSDNDDLGHLDVQGDMDASVDQAFILAPHEEDGSVYLVSYRVLKGKGDPKKVVGYVLCGTNQCDACTNAKCAHQSYAKLDRDKDRHDLKGCPPGMSHDSYITYPQWWPAADVHLRVCQRRVVHKGCDVWFFQHGWFDGRRAVLGPGRYDVSAMKAKGIHNDDISSLRVGPGCKATLYDDNHFRGHSATFTHGDYEYREFIKTKRSDVVSSIVVESA